MQTVNTADWQQQLKDTTHTIESLAQLLHLPLSALTAQLQHTRFPIKATRSYLSRIQPGCLNDPLLLQILPHPDEPPKSAQFAQTTPGFSTDPLQESRYNPVPGLLHKYHNRALIMPTGACAIHCRYCFRQNFPYTDHTVGPAGRKAQVDYLQSHPEINEVILSGGDPFVLPDDSLKKWIADLETIPHLKILRFHSRIPIVLPDRISDAFVRVLENSRLHRVIVTHCNHPQELNDDIAQKIKKLKNIGCTILNQSVLLNQVNSTPEILVVLSQTLFDTGILPYYIHLLDPVSGSQRFTVPADRIQILMHEVRKQLPGYLNPQWVQEVPGMPYKHPVMLNI
jgi:EF-P beta-lysylation protein EpmB